ncbi:hypothetical protein BJ508DRAFT_415050 [Ascobolus immersus RN42]|uniref:DUF7580 domain-containing protein n=1 Tax=Ascobolus immersus RN42 TaxID=1160509 RepID=A0A3N4I4P9_ASCIM|nr:hypothetical protein BJ508DRAFT_415050 [Ascobolus immersus RN42]
MSAELALGIVPLVVSALEHYKQAADVVRAMRDHKEEFRELHVRLQAAMVRYRDSMELLLSPLALVEEEELDNYLDSDRILLLWKHSKTASQLDEAFGRTNSLNYRAQIDILLKKLKKLILDLKLSKEGKPLWLREDGTVDPHKQEKFFDRRWWVVRSGLKSKSFQSQARVIEEAVDRIYQLVESRSVVEQQRSSRRKPARIQKKVIEGRYLKRVTEAAGRLYTSLSTLWPVTCNTTSCNYVHTASLQIKDYMDETSHRKPASPTSNDELITVNLNILFLLDKAGEPSKWDWRAVSVENKRMLEDQHNLPSARVTTITSAASSNPRPRVRFATFAPTNDDAQRANPVVVEPLSSKKIKNLCRTLRQFAVNASSSTGGSRFCMGFLEAADSLHYLYPASIPVCCSTKGGTVTLRQLLNGGWPYSMNCQEKSTIAYHLANAVLQFHDTPWLRPDWTTEDVEFILDGSPSLNLAQPIISKDFNRCSQLESSKKPSQLVKNQAVFSLGLALLELYMGKPIEAMRIAEDLEETCGVQSSLTDYITASRLLSIVEAREPSNVSEAINNCIHINLLVSRRNDAMKSYSLENDDFRAAFFEGVVLPLQNNHELLKNVGG